MNHIISWVNLPLLCHLPASILSPSLGSWYIDSFSSEFHLNTSKEAPFVFISIFFSNVSTFWALIFLMFFSSGLLVSLPFVAWPSFPFFSLSLRFQLFIKFYGQSCRLFLWFLLIKIICNCASITSCFRTSPHVRAHRFFLPFSITLGVLTSVLGSPGYIWLHSALFSLKIKYSIITWSFSPMFWLFSLPLARCTGVSRVAWL